MLDYPPFSSQTHSCLNSLQSPPPLPPHTRITLSFSLPSLFLISSWHLSFSLSPSQSLSVPFLQLAGCVPCYRLIVGGRVRWSVCVSGGGWGGALNQQHQTEINIGGWSRGDLPIQPRQIVIKAICMSNDHWLYVNVLLYLCDHQAETAFCRILTLILL